MPIPTAQVAASVRRYRTGRVFEAIQRAPDDADRVVTKLRMRIGLYPLPARGQGVHDYRRRHRDLAKGNTGQNADGGFWTICFDQLRQANSSCCRSRRDSLKIRTAFQYSRTRLRQGSLRASKPEDRAPTDSGSQRRLSYPTCPNGKCTNPIPPSVVDAASHKCPCEQEVLGIRAFQKTGHD